MRLTGLLAALLATVLLASACSSAAPKPNFSSVASTPAPTSSSPAPSESTSPTGVPTTGPNVNPGEVAPTQPANATRNTEEGALAFASYYMRTLDWVYATSKPDLLTPFFASTCSTCRSGQSFISGLVRLGDIKGGRVMIKQIGIVKNDGRGGADFAVSANVSVEAATVVSKSGATATSFPATPDTTLTEWMDWNGTAFKIVEERYA